MADTRDMSTRRPATLAQTTARMRNEAVTKDDDLSWMTPQERETYRWEQAMADEESRAFASRA